MYSEIYSIFTSFHAEPYTSLHLDMGAHGPQSSNLLLHSAARCECRPRGGIYRRHQTPQDPTRIALLYSSALDPIRNWDPASATYKVNELNIVEFIAANADGEQVCGWDGVA